MRICMVSDNYYPYIGGIAEHIHHLARELRQRGNSVKILTTNVGTRMMDCLEQVPDESEVFRIGRGLVIRSNKSFARVPVAIRPVARVKKYFEEQGFEIIHMHGSLAPTLPLVALRASRVVNVFTFHANHDKSIGYALARSFLLPYFRAIHGKIAVSTAARDSAAKYFPGEYRIIPNGIDVQFFRPDVAPVPELNNGRPKILFLGRFEPRKGLKYLLMALPEIVREIPDVQLVVVGTGLLGYAYKGYLDKEVEKNVYWAGLIPGEARPAYYRSCDLFCSPAIGYESFGIVLLEAMATGRPVVASDIVGYRTVLTPGEQGFLVPPRDPHRLAQAIVKILKEPELARKMGEAGRRRALEFSWGKVAEQVEQFYQELLDRYPIPRFQRY
ncbi:MAG: glycosyltransferase family 4 protein [candidate division WOR-3 bacterium]|jgi:phosphatidylinositol alpha-mannosyltransferase|nr:glycosyltransferase family 4 protein [candidate division WOR-3 bacterium]MCR4424229.1 glycosyltransferase family 4 protein [candidate division WOR-3 bacterium]MDH7519353.1 glycosyltransferase family 4 protein [bacterium]